MLLDWIKKIRDFIVSIERRDIDVTKLYSVNDFGGRLLIPDGRDELNRFSYTRVIWVTVDELSAKTPVTGLRYIAESLTPRTAEERPHNVHQTVYIFAIRKMLGRFHSKRIGNDIFLFFNAVKLGLNGIKFRVYKIIGRLFIKRADKIVEATREKIGKEPYGFLKDLVEFFISLGTRMVDIARKSLSNITNAIRRSNSNATTSNSNYTSISNSSTNRVKNAREDRSEDDVKVDLILNAQPVIPSSQPRRRVAGTDIVIT